MWAARESGRWWPLLALVLLLAPAPQPHRLGGGIDGVAGPLLGEPSQLLGAAHNLLLRVEGAWRGDGIAQHRLLAERAMHQHDAARKSQRNRKHRHAGGTACLDHRLGPSRAAAAQQRAQRHETAAPVKRCQPASWVAHR